MNRHRYSSLINNMHNLLLSYFWTNIQLSEKQSAPFHSHTGQFLFYSWILLMHFQWALRQLDSNTIPTSVAIGKFCLNCTTNINLYKSHFVYLFDIHTTTIKLIIALFSRIYPNLNDCTSKMKVMVSFARFLVWNFYVAMAGIILDMVSSNERWHYNVTLSLIG